LRSWQTATAGHLSTLAEDGKLIALTEYMDTALAERVLVPPQ
jgi:hypothetical protein